MRESSSRPIALIVLILLVFNLGSVRHTLAQDATPEAPSVHVSAYLETETEDGQTLTLLHATFDPGSEVTWHYHPGTSIFLVESGAITFLIQDGTATLTRSGGEPEELASGDEVVLHAGDSIAYGGDVMITDANFGEEPATVIVTSIREAGEPFTAPVEGTPAS